MKVKIVQTDLGYIHINDDNYQMLKKTLSYKNNFVLNTCPDVELKLAMQKFEMSWKLKNNISE